MDSYPKARENVKIKTDSVYFSTFCFEMCYDNTVNDFDLLEGVISMEDNIYTVNVAGFDVKLYSSETEAETTSIVKAVNRKITQFEQGNKGAPKINSILLACMDFCDENRQLKEKLERQRNKIASLKAQLQAVKDADGGEDGE